MKYIKMNYDRTLNTKQEYKKLSCTNKNFICKNGTVNVVVSAPHNVFQVREGKRKAKDIGSGIVAVDLQINTDSFLIIRTQSVGIVGMKDDDPNFEPICEYKTALSKMINANKIKALLDIHSLAKTRDVDINLGINGGVNINNDYALLEKIKSLFINAGFSVKIDYPFSASQNCVSSYTNRTHGIFSLQVEINSRLIDIDFGANKFGKLSLCLQKTISVIDSTIS